MYVDLYYLLYSHKKYSSELSIVTDRGNTAQSQEKAQISTSVPNSVPEPTKARLSTHRSDHEIHTPEHRSFGQVYYMH